MPSPRIALLSAISAEDVDPTGDFRPFSYGARKLEASLLSDTHAATDLAVQVFDYDTLDPDPFVETLADFEPTLVGASAYIWSLPTFLEVARRLKARRPDVVFVLGGPTARASVMRLPPYRPFAPFVDALVPGEGESIIRALAHGHLDPAWRRLPGLVIPTGTDWISTGPAPRPKLDDYPSPYHLRTAPEGRTGYLETFRGCPIHCTFCQWGEKRADRVYSSGYLARQLEVMKETGVRDIFFLDAGFNLSARGFHNLVEAERTVGLFSSAYAYGHIYPTHLKEEHIDVITTFEKVQLSVGIQSFEPAVLREIDRPFDIGRFERMLALLRGRMEISIEIILGLPGDRPEWFKRTFDRACELADTVRVFWCLVLPDALLDRQRAEQAIRFDPRTWKLVSSATWPERALRETWDWVCARAAEMPRATIHADWVGFGTSETPAEYRWGAPIEPKTTGSGVEGGTVSSRLDRALEDRIERAIFEANLSWRPIRVYCEATRLFVDLETPKGTLTLVAEAAEAGSRYFERRNGIGNSP